MRTISLILCIAICTGAVAAELPDGRQFRELCRNAVSLEGDNQKRAVEVISHLAPSSIPAFAALLNADSEDEDVRSGAAVALGIFGAPARPYIPDLAKVLNGPSSSLAEFSAQVLADLVRQDDVAVVPELVKRLANYPPDCSFECDGVIRALGKIGPSAREALPILRKMANDRHLSCAIQAAAIQSVGKIEAGAKP